MGDTFDPYREALIVETATVWPAEYDDVDAPRRAEIEAALHADAEHAAHLTYHRMHTGFLREITVTADDIERLG